MDDTPRVVRIAALIPHSNIDRTIGRIQEEIFSTFGLSSALALPPMIPLRFLRGDVLPEEAAPGDPPPGDETMAGIRTLDGLTVQTTTLRVVGSALYLGTEFRLPGGSRRDSAVQLGVDDILGPLSLGTGAGEALFPPAPGFFLCVDEKACSERESRWGEKSRRARKASNAQRPRQARPSALLQRVAKAATPAPALRFHPLGISVFAVDAQSSRCWWRALSWEMQSLIRLRKERGPG